ncbi:MAG: prealbumin-like fold domain-containing protein, partial [Eubacterium sp.]
NMTTAEAAQKIVNAAGNSKKAYIYNIKDTSVTPNVEESVLLIPYLAEWQGGKEGKTLKFEYTTVVHDVKEGSKPQTLKNEAKLLWQYKYAPGPNPGKQVEFDGGVTKDTSTNYDMISKSADNYNEQTQIMTWTLQTKYYGKSVGKTTITDIIPNGQTLIEKDITYAYDNGAKGALTTDSTKEAYYTYNETSKTLVIYADPLKNNAQTIKISVPTKVEDSAILAAGNGVISNKTSITTKVEETEVKSSAEAKHLVTNTMIQKTVETGKEYKNNLMDKNPMYHKIGWEVTVNPNHVPITGAVITDTLPTAPDGTTVISNTPEISKIVKIDEDKTETTWDTGKWKEHFTLDEAKLGKFSLTAVDKATPDKATYKVYFTTTMTANWLKKNSTDKDSTSKILNKVALTGKVGETQISNATASAETPAKNTSLQKIGSVDTNGLIEWKVYINTGSTDMKEVSLVENFDNPETKPYLELVADAKKFTLSKATVDEKGELTVGGKIDGVDLTNKAILNFDQKTKNGTAVYDEDYGFTFKIPDSHANEPLVLTFYTFALQNIPANNTIKNNVSLEKDEDGTTTDQETTESGLDDAFNTDDYGKMSGIPCIEILKQSTNGKKAVKAPKQDPTLMLKGATFEMKSYKVSTDSPTYTSTYKKTKTTTTGETGTALFGNLRENYVYKITETQAPGGYDLVSTPYYFVVGATADVVKDSYTLTESDGKTTEVKKKDITWVSDAAGCKIMPLEVKDTPTANFEFTKVGNDGTALPSCTFTLTRDKGDWADRIEVPAIAKNTMTSTSGSDGKVNFTNLDPGTYTLAETAAPAEYFKTGTYTVTVSTTGDVNVVQKESGSMKLTGDGSESSPFKIQNTYANGTISIKKVDAELATLKLSGAVFELYDGLDQNCTGTAIQESTSGSDGVAIFKNIP